MKNITSYYDFMNEGVFSKRTILFDKLLKIAKEISPSEITSRNSYGIINRLNFTYSKAFNIDFEIDPYGEDADLKSIEVEVSVSAYTEKHKLLINNNQTSLTNSEAKKIYDILYNKYIARKSEEICRDLGADDLYHGLVKEINDIDPNKIIKGTFDEYTIIIDKHIIKFVKQVGILSDPYELVIDNDIFPSNEAKTNKLVSMLKNKYKSFYKNQRDTEIETFTDFL